MAKVIEAKIVVKENNAFRMAIFLSGGKAGKKVRKDWTLSSSGTDLIFIIGDKNYYADLMPTIRKVLGAAGVR